MKLLSTWRSFAAAFTLVEVALAMGVASFCLIVVLGLVPIGVDTGQAASDQTAAGSILTHVLTDLRATPPVVPPATTATSTEYAIVFPSNTAGAVATTPQTRYFGNANQQFYYLASQPVAAPPAGSRYRLTVSFLPPAGGKAATQASLLVTWPAQVDPNNAATGKPTGRVQIFTALDRN